MTSRSLLRSFFVLAVVSAMAAGPALADSSHARIVRLSQVQGDVRVAHDVRHGQDPLSDSSLVWEAAQLNLRTREGYVLGTDEGRAEEDFEDGAMAYMSWNTLLAYNEVSLYAGVPTSRRVISLERV